MHIIDTIIPVMSPIKETTFTIQSTTVFKNECSHSVGDWDSSAVPEIGLRKLHQLVLTISSLKFDMLKNKVILPRQILTSSI